MFYFHEDEGEGKNLKLKWWKIWIWSEFNLSSPRRIKWCSLWLFFIYKISFFGSLALCESKMYGNFIVKLCKALGHHFNESTHSLPFSGLCSVLITFFVSSLLIILKTARKWRKNLRYPTSNFLFNFLLLHYNCSVSVCGITVVWEVEYCDIKKSIFNMLSIYSYREFSGNLCSQNMSLYWF